MTQPAGHALVDQWTGRHASALQAALRLSRDEMASELGVAKRTIANWHDRPELVIRAELQRALDTAYERASEAAKIRFARQLSAGDKADFEEAGSTVKLAVAISVVMNDDEVLVVCRRDPDPSGITWQFPAGIIKPGAPHHDHLAPARRGPRRSRSAAATKPPGCLATRRGPTPRRPARSCATRTEPSVRRSTAAPARRSGSRRHWSVASWAGRP
jgi:DNA-binding XRE family transcriptional regulator